MNQDALDFEEDMEQDRDPLPVRRETGPLMFLSLFLLLLAFFILLNSLATLRETKSRDVLTSVASTFQTDTDPTQNAEILVSTIGPVLEPELVLDEVERLWLSEIPFVKIDRLTTGRHMMVEFPIIQLFVGGEASLRSDRGDLIRATAHVLSARFEDQAVIMQATLFVNNLDSVPVVPDPAIAAAANQPLVIDINDPEASLNEERTIYDGTELAFARTGILARGLIQGGAPPGNLEVGLRAGNESRVRFRFFIRDVENAFLTFTEAEEGGAQ